MEGGAPGRGTQMAGLGLGGKSSGHRGHTGTSACPGFRGDPPQVIFSSSRGPTCLKALSPFFFLFRKILNTHHVLGPPHRERKHIPVFRRLEIQRGNGTRVQGDRGSRGSGGAGLGFHRKTDFLPEVTSEWKLQRRWRFLRRKRREEASASRVLLPKSP